VGETAGPMDGGKLRNWEVEKMLLGEAKRFDICGAEIAARQGRIAKKPETDRKLKGREDRIRRIIIYI